MASRANELVNLTATGEVAGAATATVLPTVTGKWVRFKALSDNVGKVYIGVTSGVTKADGTTDTTTGIPILPGEWTDWLPMPNNNLNSFYKICDNAGDDFIYVVLG